MIKQRSSEEIRRINEKDNGEASLETVWFILLVGLFILLCWVIIAK